MVIFKLVSLFLKTSTMSIFVVNPKQVNLFTKQRQ